MKAMLMMLLLVTSVCAQEAPTLPSELSVSGLTTLVGQKIQEAKGATVVDFRGHLGAGLYLPIWTFHTADKSADFFEFPNIGYRSIQASKPSGFISSSCNLTAISAWIWRSNWADTHVRRSPFPPIFFGPTVIFPLDWSARKLSVNNWQDWTGLVLSIRLK